MVWDIVGLVSGSHQFSQKRGRILPHVGYTLGVPHRAFTIQGLQRIISYFFQLLQ